MQNTLIRYSLLFNAITLSMMLLIIFEVANKVELLLKMLGIEMYMMMYITSTEKGQVLMDANSSNMTLNEKKVFFNLIKEADDFFTSTSLISLTTLLLIIVYISYILIRFIIQKNNSIKNYKKLELYSDKKNIVFLDKHLKQIANSFKLFSKNYISVHIAFLSKVSESKKKFIIQHEIFHGKSYDTIIKTIILSSYIFLPVFIFSFLSIPIFIELFVKPMNINILNSSYYISYILFSFIIGMNIYMYLQRKDILLIFFHYKEYLADYYAYITTQIIYAYNNEKDEKKSYYHPTSKNRKAFITGKKQLSIDMYFYILTLIYISKISYQIPSLILISLLFVFFIFRLKHLYIGVTCFLLSIGMIIVSKVSLLFVFNENFSNKDLTKIETVDILFIIILVLSYLTSKFNTRKL